MPDLRWTMPVGHWSFWSATSATKPDAGFIEPMVRRRLSSLSRAALKVAHDCADGQPAMRMVFASRHGELRRTTDILRTITAAEPVSPNAFSLSVLNAMSGIFGIARGDRSPATAISAGAETLGYALLEAYAQHIKQPSPPVLVVYADEPADALYGKVEDEVQESAVAILLDADTAQGLLECTVRGTGQAGEAAAGARFATQSEALCHCLDSRQAATWQSASANWQWRWHDRTA
ncbi:beta-ketoacyl synthase chain length factor [Paraburkholderia phenazinium]|uniref:Beta-ketoacyl synthase, N-terminal domain n=1 Tax=Paraburkholderia phenazinium TaxID=60549 RepID=A0A1G7Q7J9_9BURK|nr:beta-ketoacyl synthase chain length factor [Paraburkholderia phenazinium]SDF94501.1 Beta-ketoacyl synthase, N-terminal domain [Paraburkholderia phenazinium]